MANFFNDNILLKLKSLRSQNITSGSSTVNMAMQSLTKFSTYLQDKLPTERAFMDIISVSDEMFPDDILDRPLTLSDSVSSESELAFACRHDIVDLFMHVMDENNSYIITLSNGDCVELRYEKGDINYVYNSDSYLLYTESDDEVTLWLVLKTAKEGKLISVWDLLADLKASFTINEMLDGAISTIRSNSTIALSDLRARLHEFAESQLSSVKKATNIVLDAFGRAGFYGAVQAIISFVKSIATVHVGDDGLLEFTNNDSLVPKVYIVGGLAAIFTTLTQVAGLILSALSKVIGAVMFVASGILNTVFGASSYDYATKTKARLVEEANSVLTPYGLSQIERDVGNWESNYAKAKLGNQIPFAVSVPGGQVLISSNDDKYRMEFHPDIIDRRGCLHDFTVNDHPLCNYTRGDGYWTLNFQVTSLDRDTELVDFVDCCMSTNNSLLENELDGIATDKSDKDLREIVTCNIFLFIMFIQAFHSGSLSNLDVWWTDLSGPARLGNVPFNTTNFDCTSDQFTGIASIIYQGYNIASVAYDPTSNLPTPTWKNISDAVSCISSSNLTYGVGSFHDKTIYYALPLASNILSTEYLMDDVYDLPYNLSYAIKIPQYDRGSFWATTIALSLAAAIVVTVGVVATLGTIKAIRNKKGQNARNLEAQWEAYKANPTQENLAAYQKSVKKNNLFNKVFGGTQYSREGLWASTDSSESVTSKFCESLVPLSQSEDNQSASTDQATILDAINNIRGLITGTFFTPDNV